MLWRVWYANLHLIDKAFAAYEKKCAKAIAKAQAKAKAKASNANVNANAGPSRRAFDVRMMHAPTGRAIRGRSMCVSTGEERMGPFNHCLNGFLTSVHHTPPHILPPHIFTPRRVAR